MTTNAEAVTWNSLNVGAQNTMRTQVGTICGILHDRTMIRWYKFDDDQTVTICTLGGAERTMHLTVFIRKFEVLAVSLV